MNWNSIFLILRILLFGRKSKAAQSQTHRPVEKKSEAGLKPSRQALKQIAPETITVAIFCTFPYEVAAIRNTLDEQFSCHFRSVSPQRCEHTFGRIGRHLRVVIARPNQIGNVNAAHAAAAVNHQFPNVRYALMVGIGGGIPSATHDIRLGDIAVSVPGTNRPAVVQYDFGSYEASGFSCRGGGLNKPPAILLSANRVMEEDEMMNKSSLAWFLQEIINKAPTFQRPNIRGVGNLPKVHRGLILSGDGMIEDPRDRYQMLSGHPDAICYETGAAGIMDEIPCLVVRGICGYADRHKHDGVNHYAAAAAAAYCKALLWKIEGQAVASPGTYDPRRQDRRSNSPRYLFRRVHNKCIALLSIL